MILDRFELRSIRIPLKAPFEISSYRFTAKTALVLKGYTRNGITGWAEGEHLEAPWYTAETVKTGLDILSSVILPSLLGKSFPSVEDVKKYLSWIQGNQLSLALVDNLFHDLFARAEGASIGKFLGIEAKSVPAGVSVGLHDSPESLTDTVAERVATGYPRVKVKVKPDKDRVFLEHLRQQFPDLPLMIDANAAYGIEDADHLADFDRFALMMIEQPLHNGDLVDHAILANRIKTPVCLDESIHTIHDARAAAALGSCAVVNIKPPRVGGILEVIRMQNFLHSVRIPAWCGGMFETGLGRAVNLACAGLPNFVYPGDLSPPEDYLEFDIVEEPYTLNPDGTVAIPSGPGVGVTVDIDALEKCTSLLRVFP
ncbi:MAG: o-succinylbenzoate synthase [Anaerolineales bacterium]